MARPALLALALAFVAPASAAQIGPLDFVEQDAYDVSSALETVAALLPEVPRHHAAWLDPAAGTSLLLTQNSTVELVLLREDSDRAHALGHFTHTAGGAVLDRQLAFPDLSLWDKGALQPGDAVTLRDASGEVRLFPAGTRLGFFLAAHGAKHKTIKKWDPLTAELPYASPALNAEVGDGVFSSLDALNPENVGAAPDLARHVALLDVPNLLPGGKQTYVLGFESQDRRGPNADHDFNDVILIVRLTAADDGDLTAINANDPDGDGLRGSFDLFPGDSERADVLRVPSHGLRLMGLDDEYPLPGDGDMNDTVLGWAARLVVDADGDVKEIVFDAHLLARGSAGDHVLGLHLPGVPNGTTGTYQVERFHGPASATLQSEPPRQIADFISQDERRIEALLPSSLDALPMLPGSVGVNTESAEPEAYAASSRLRMVFADPIPQSTLGPPPWDLYWLIDTVHGQADVHQAGFDAFDDRPAGLPVESGDGAFLGDDLWPWLMELPRQQRFAREDQPVEQLYPRFFKWALEHGESFPDWPDKLSKGKASAPADAYLLPRAFTLASDLP